jgi:hypothetical protein
MWWWLYGSWIYNYLKQYAISLSVTCNRSVVICNVCLCFVSTEKIGDWDPMMEDYFSARNSYKIDVDDAGVATVGYSMYQCCTKYIPSI